MTEKNIPEIRYLLGIDGGGTKTEFLLTDIHESEINRIILGPSNPVNAGFEKTEAVISEGIESVCKNTDFRGISVFAGIAGGISGDNKALINSLLSRFGFGAYANGSDADCAVEAALHGENGVAVIMGTGIVAFGLNNGETCRAAGRGFMIDKGGSGFCFGSDALNSAFCFLDGRGGSETILCLAEKKLGKPLQNCVNEIYAGGAEFVASFAPIVFEAYKKGDEEAERIIDRNAKEAACIIRAADKFLSRRAVICGGLCRQKEILKPFLMKYLGEDYTLEFSTVPAVNGAVSLAKSLISGGENQC